MTPDSKMVPKDVFGFDTKVRIPIRWEGCWLMLNVSRIRRTKAIP